MGLHPQKEKMLKDSIRIKYRAKHPNWEYFTKVCGEFMELTSIGKAKNSIIIIEAEFGVAECEVLVYHKEGQWRFAVGTNQNIKAEVNIDPEKNYQYLVKIVGQGRIHCNAFCEGVSILEWEGEHGGRHDYFNNFNTSLEVTMDNKCSSRHRATHRIIDVWDSRDEMWLDTTKAYEAYDIPYGKINTKVSPPLKLDIAHYYGGDVCKATYRGAPLLEDKEAWNPQQYDINNNGVITAEEALSAAMDHFNGLITREQALSVMQLYYHEADTTNS